MNTKLYVYVNENGEASVFDDKALAEEALQKSKEWEYSWRDTEVSEIELNYPGHFDGFVFTLDSDWNIVEERPYTFDGKVILRAFEKVESLNDNPGDYAIEVTAYSKDELWEFLTPARRDAFDTLMNIQCLKETEDEWREGEPLDARDAKLKAMELEAYTIMGVDPPYRYQRV